MLILSLNVLLVDLGVHVGIKYLFLDTTSLCKQGSKSQ